jgi:hypothetical protein
MVGWYEFDSIEDLVKTMEDERLQHMVSAWTYLVDNAKRRLLRPSLTIPEELQAEWESKIK